MMTLLRVVRNSFILLFVFVFCFFVTTAFFDILERHMGYYDQGIQESQEVGK